MVNGLTLGEYRKLTGIFSQLTNTLALTFAKDLASEGSMLKTTLSKLTDQESSLLLSALITNNQKVLSQFLQPVLETLIITDLKPLAAQIPENNNWLNPTVTLLIQNILSQDHNRTKRLLRTAMQLIPDSKIHIKAKVAICREIDFSAAYAITDYSYNESLTPLSTNRFTGTISTKEFKTAVRSTPLDYSEFIMLALGLLQGKGLEQELNQIRHLYLNTHYEEAIDSIRKLANKQSILLNPDLSNSLIQSSNQLSEVEIYRNYSRRFFENRLSQLYSGMQTTFASVDRISQRLINKKVNTQHDLESAILIITELKNEDVANRYKTLIEESPFFKLQDRMDKVGFVDKSMEARSQVLGREVYSKNKGVLTSNTPNFYDEISEQEMRNRVVDTTSTCENEDLYSFSKPRVAFTASLSGHSFLLAAVLEQYINKYHDDTNLQMDVNNLIKSVIAVYISYGYHSLFEIVDVFKEPVVKKIFDAHNLVLDLSWQDDLLEKASKDTQEYTKTLCLRKATRISLTSSSFFSNSNSESPQADVNKCLLSEIQRSNK